jgi:hypothetical protein
MFGLFVVFALLSLLLYQVLQSSFNPRSRAGSDTLAIGSLSSPREFQSTLPRRERPEKLQTQLLPAKAGRFGSAAESGLKFP